jgi:hypothetical protein
MALNKALNKALKTDLSSLAQIIQSKGRGKDTVLAHITPQEAALLKRRGGRGSINPDTGLPEFQDDYGGSVDYNEMVGLTGREATTPLPSGVEALPEAGIAPMPYTGGYAQPDYAYRPDVIEASDLAPGAFATAPRGQAITRGPMAGATLYDPEKYSQVDVNRISSGLEPKGTPVSDKLTNQDLIRLGLAGGLSGLGLLTSRKAGGQIAQQQEQQQSLAQPYKQQGQQLIEQAQAGALNPQSQAALEAARAQINQNVATRGGVGAQQAANQLATIYNQLLSNQYNQGLQISQIGDQIALGAIKTGMQLDQQLNATNQAFYTQIASIAAGLPLYGTTPRG